METAQVRIGKSIGVLQAVTYHEIDSDGIDPERGKEPPACPDARVEHRRNNGRGKSFQAQKSTTGEVRARTVPAGSSGRAAVRMAMG